MAIRVASIDDARSIREIYAPYVIASPATFDLKPPTLNAVREKIRHLSPDYPFFVAEVDSRVVGYCYASTHHERQAYRWSVDVSVYLAATYHGRGLGTSLYERLMATLRRQGFRIAMAGITLPNAASVALHEAFGFQQVALLPKVGYKLGDWRDVGWWALDLDPELTTPHEPIPFAELSS